jgi:pimeloyl-ACP methyl ester carboxylesterase
MKNLREYGGAPFSVAVIHGGPGAAGEMAPVAHRLASSWGVLEPVQTAMSLEGQVEELKSVLEDNADTPVTLIGFSWGAWLSFIVAARYPAIIEKLILIGSGPYEAKYAGGIIEGTRLSRLDDKERTEVESLIRALNDAATEDKNSILLRLGILLSKADAYDPIGDVSGEFEAVDCRADIFQSVWPEAAEMRKSGELIALTSKIQCPVVAIHGDYDPHPAEGVKEPLSAVKGFRFILLKNCGHRPWIERDARDEFFQILEKELEVIG